MKYFMFAPDYRMVDLIAFVAALIFSGSISLALICLINRRFKKQ